MGLVGILAMALLPAASEPPAVVPVYQTPTTITVSGSGMVTTPPDQATIEYGVHGEGATSDQAVTQMVEKRKRIDAGLAGFGKQIDSGATQVAVAEVRGQDCRAEDGASRLSTGNCAIIGYTADISMTIRTPAVTRAGTIVGLIGRLQGTNPHVTAFEISDKYSAQRRALAAALADARKTAEAIAQGANVKLGRLVLATNSSDAGSVIPMRVPSPAMVMVPPPPPPPIEVDLVPQPIETNAEVTVSYETAS